MPRPLLQFWFIISLSISAPLSAACQSFQSSNLPLIFINTNGSQILDEPKIIASMGIVDNGPGQRNYIADTFNGYNGQIGIEIRGSSSQMFPKKQYGIELLDQDGVEIDASLLGLPPENDWVLFAPYNDKSLMRDVLAYRLARDMGMYAPRTKFCELFLNGNYQGIYVLIEKIKRDQARVNIDNLEPTDMSGDDLTGGYIIKIDKQTGETNLGWFSQNPPRSRGADQRVNFLYEYPSSNEITAAQSTYIQNFMSTFEQTLLSSEFSDPVDGYESLIDVQSFIDFFIINEISRNVDGYRLSTFMHKQKNSDGGKLYMGPVWDFNLGFGNADYCDGWKTSGLAMSFNSVCPKDWWLVPFWWSRLFEDGSFARKTSLRWSGLRQNLLSDQRINALIDSIAISLGESQQRNFQRWPVLGTYVWPNYFIGNSFQQEVSWLKSWVSQRSTWLDNYLGNFVTDVEIVQHSDITPRLYPNPFNNVVTVDYPIETHGKLEVAIFDALGKQVKSMVFQSSEKGPHEIPIDQTLRSGVYLYKISLNGKPVAYGKILRI
jgi:hypothetical protein